MVPGVYLECLRLIAERDELPPCTLHPAMISEIMAVEEELSAQLPEQYENFLLDVGVGVEHGGLAAWYHLDVTKTGNLLDANQHLRHDQAQEMREHGRRKSRYPKDFLAIYDPREGEVFGFVKDGTRYGSQIFMWDLEEYFLEAVASDLEEFLAQNLDLSETEIESAEKRFQQRNGNSR